MLTSAFAAFLFMGAAQGQKSDAAPAKTASFTVADVHVSPHSSMQYEYGGQIIGTKYVLHNATMEDMIAAAYSVDPAHVYGGPPWIEWDHYDITALAPAGSSQATAHLMLQSVLKDRFKLVAHPDTKPLPALALTVAKDKPKMKESAGDGDPDCEYVTPAQKPAPGTAPDIAFKCKSETMEALVKQLRYWGFGGYYLSTTVLDNTGLKGSYDFDIHWSMKNNLAKEGPDGITIYDAIEKQLGLHLGPTTAPQPVMMVERVNELPTPNVANLNQLMPPQPPAEFDVATIKPSRPDETSPNGRVNGGQVSVQFFTLNMLIPFAWQIPEEMVVGAPKSVADDHYDINAKVDVPPLPPGADKSQQMQISMDDLMSMLRGLITERFEMKSHMEDRPLEAYTLIAVNPKLTKADPANRTGCKEGPGADGKDPRLTNPALGRLTTCHNITMAQFAEQLTTMADGYIHTPVIDATGIKGNYDFTLSYSRQGQLQAASGAPAAADAAGGGGTAPSDPSGGMSIFDAISKELGLKLEKTKRPVPVLVIDHIDEKPTDN